MLIIANKTTIFLFIVAVIAATMILSVIISKIVRSYGKEKERRTEIQDKRKKEREG